MIATKTSKSIRQELEELPQAVHLTGSRLFGNHTSNSDWDFYTQWSQDLEDTLLKNGWKVVPLSEGYMDSNMCVVMKKGNVDLQLVHDVYIRHQIHCVMTLCGILPPPKICTTLVKDFWNTMFTLSPYMTKASDSYLTLCEEKALTTF